MSAPGSIKVVYVEDDERLARLTAQYLGTHSVSVIIVPRGEDAVEEVIRSQPDVVLLDLMLPGQDGLEVCRKLREHVETPIVMVTARGEEADRVIGLEGGADDYVSKPFSSRELLARIRAQARRAQGRVGPTRKHLEVGPFVINSDSRIATLDGVILDLTTYEFSLLRALCERVNRVLSREQILDLVQGSADQAFDRTIDVHISRIRSKIGDNSRRPRFLKTVRGVGYVLTVEDA